MQEHQEDDDNLILLSHLQTNNVNDFRRVYQQIHALANLPHPLNVVSDSTDSTATIATSPAPVDQTTLDNNQVVLTIYRTLNALFVQSWNDYIEASNQNDINLALRKLSTDYEITNATHAASMALDAEPAVDPIQLKALIRQQVREETKTLRTELTKTKQQLQDSKNSKRGNRSGASQQKEKGSADVLGNASSKKDAKPPKKNSKQPNKSNCRANKQKKPKSFDAYLPQAYLHKHHVDPFLRTHCSSIYNTIRTILHPNPFRTHGVHTFPNAATDLRCDISPTVQAIEPISIDWLLGTAGLRTSVIYSLRESLPLLTLLFRPIAGLEAARVMVPLVLLLLGSLEWTGSCSPLATPTKDRPQIFHLQLGTEGNATEEVKAKLVMPIVCANPLLATLIWITCPL